MRRVGVPVGHRQGALGLGLCLAAAIGACSDEEGGLSRVRPKLELSPDAGAELRFADVVLSRSLPETQVITAANVGDGTLSFTSISIEGEHASAFVVYEAPTQLRPSESGKIGIRFSPGGPLPAAEAVLRIRSNDPDRGDVTFALRGTAREPCVLAADQGRMEFLVGQVQTLTVRSLSTAACTIRRISTDQSVFPIRNLPPLPVTIPGGGSIALEIEHVASGRLLSGAPVRDLFINELEGGELDIVLVGEPPLFGCFDIRPDQIIFPETPRGERLTRNVTVRNRCPKAATITSAVLSAGAETYTVGGGPFPLSVAPGGTETIPIEYRPLEAFGDYGQLVVSTNDSSLPRIRIPITGHAAVPHMEHFPPSLDFGNVIYRSDAESAQRSECSSSARTVVVYNAGRANLTVSEIRLDEGADADFEILGVVVGGQPITAFDRPFQVPPETRAEVSIVFYPTRSEPSAHKAKLLIRHDDGDRPNPAVIDLGGRATLDGPVTDRFQQLEGPKVDILWVIDNSCSMYDEQARLIQNMSQFVGYADAQNADYQMGVIVTDSRSPQAGVLQFCYPHPRIIAHDYPEREEAFKCLFDVGVNGPYVEAGLGAAMRALERAQSSDSDRVRNPNYGFLRPDSNVAVVVVSDEEDQSNESLDLLKDFYDSVKGAGRTTVHAIAGPVAEPCPNRQSLSPGIRYHWMARETGGLFFNICNEDWTPVLQNLGLNVFVALESWALTQAADPASIEVAVGGVPVLPSTQNGFTYNAATNSIDFHGAAVPAPGQTIEAKYLGNCRP